LFFFTRYSWNIKEKFSVNNKRVIK
jgi:hypothetical protein